MAFISKKECFNCLIRKLESFYLPRQRWSFVVPTSLAMLRMLSVTCFPMQKALSIRMYFSVVIIIIIIIYSTCPVCVRLFVAFCHHAHLDPKIIIGTCTYIRVHRRGKLLYNYIIVIFAKMLRSENTDTNGIHATWA